MTETQTIEFQTEDIALAAYLRVKGYKLNRAEKLSRAERNSKRMFYFHIPSEEVPEIKLAFVQSDYLRFYNELIALKRL